MGRGRSEKVLLNTEQRKKLESLSHINLGKPIKALLTLRARSRIALKSLSSGLGCMRNQCDSLII